MMFSCTCSIFKILFHFNNNTTNNIPHRPSEVSPSLPTICPFENKRFPPPKAPNIVERKLQALAEEVDRLIFREMKRSSHKPNLFPKDRKLLKIMKNDDNHYIPSDKGGELVIMTSSQYASLADDHLSDNSTYQRIPNDPTDSQEQMINNLWKKASSKTHLPNSMVKKLITRHSRIGQFYHLPKTHKQNLSVRPIVSGINTPCEKMAWLLHQLLVPFLTDVPAHLENTHQLISKLSSVPAEKMKGKTAISLDVVSLYTNVNAQDSIRITIELLKRKYGDSVWGISIEAFEDILTFILCNNCFHFNGSFFKQIRGLAMGSKISPILAILVMNELESSALFKETLLHPPVFLRYIDDCVVIIDRDADFELILQRLNTTHASIKFELEKVRDDEFLPVLDTAIRLSDNGHLQYKFFVKEANRRLFIHANSSLPESIKRNAIRSEVERAKSLCSQNSWKDHAVQHMQRKFLSNGYTHEKIKQYLRPPRQRNNQSRSFDGCVLKIPFVSDKFNGQIKRIVKKHSLDIRVVTQPSPSLTRLLNKNRRFLQCNKRSCILQEPKTCNARNVVYRATCSVCEQFYIGSTSPPFHNRVAQHLQPSRKTAVSLHALSHSMSAKEIFKFTILSRHPTEIRCRIAEALVIDKLSPPLNGKEEFLDYRPFLI